MDLFSRVREVPQINGLTYIADFITSRDEEALIERIDSELWLADLTRRVQHYGYRYDYITRNITKDSKLKEMPDWVKAQSEKLAAARIFEKNPDQVIINEYEAGQGIAAHIDCIPCFGGVIASLSLGSTCMMDFTHPPTEQKCSVFLEPRSLLILTGDTRFLWQHAIPPRRTDKLNGLIYPRQRRLSLTFRNVKLA